MKVVGVDIGTQSLKAVVCDDDLTVLGVGARAYSIDHPAPGAAEQDPRVWEGALAPAIAEALREAAATAEEIGALAVCGQLDGCVPVDACGRAVAPCLIWMDRRAVAHVPEIDVADFRRRTGLVADAGHMAAKIAYLEAAGIEAATYHQPVSYLVHRLTGHSAMDRSLASTTMLLELASGEYADDLLDLFGVRAESLPALAAAHDIAGPLHEDGARISGLRAGIPVAVGTGDDFATPLGAGLIGPGPVACVLGTAEVVGAVHPELAIDDLGLLETHRYATGGFFVENPGWLAGGAVAWARSLLGFADDRELDAAAARSEPGARGVVFLPALSGAMAPRWRAGARGAFYGLTPAHDRGDLARAVLEGCAHAMRDVVQRLDEMGIAAEPIWLLGGGARSELWAQIRASAVRRPVVIRDVPEACARGAALLAAVAGGGYRDLATAATAIPDGGVGLVPNAAEAEALDDAHRRYRALFDALEPLF